MIIRKELSHPRIRSFFAEEVEPLREQLSRLDGEIAADAVPQVGDAFHQRVREAVVDSVAACKRIEDEFRHDEPLVREIQQAFRSATAPWFDRSWFANRARTKPSGFPGDYQMLRTLYDQAMPPTQARGLGGYLDLCLMDSPLANAVRSRLADAREFLIREAQSRSGDVRILDIASGPCREYVDWPAMPDQKQVEVIAMDSDPEALQFVEENVADRLDTASLKPVRYNALRTRSAASNRKNFGSFDIIYSVGLCDYLTDRHLVSMLGAWRDTLNDGGVLYVAFKDTEHYDETLYQWHLDWFFYQRSCDDVLELYRAAGFDVDAMELKRDDTGIIVSYTSRHSAGQNRPSANGVRSPHFAQARSEKTIAD